MRLTISLLSLLVFATLARGGAWRFTELFVNGKRQTRARLPGYRRLEPVVARHGRAGPRDFLWVPRGHAEELAERRRHRDQPDPPVLLADQIIARKAVDEKARTAMLAAPTPAYAVCAGNPFRAENVPEGVTRPGTWSLDTKTGVVTLWQEDDVDLARSVVTDGRELFNRSASISSPRASAAMMRGLSDPCSYRPADYTAILVVALGALVMLLHFALRSGLILVAPLVVSLPALSSELDRALLRQAPNVLRQLKDRGYGNVGVLKFRIQKGDEPASDNAGTLNLSLARRFQIALILALPADGSLSLGILRDASANAARLPGASHLTREGRKEFFSVRYALAWGGKEVEADAFITGVAKVASDLKTITIHLLVFDRVGGELTSIGEAMTVPLDAATLVEIGESFSLRGAFDGGKITPDGGAVQAVQVRRQQAPFPLRDGKCPVSLEVRYDDQIVPFVLKEGRALIREPDAGQRITFTLRHTGSDRGRYGVVLLVNGENTLFRERRPPHLCSLYVIDAERPVTTVRGYVVADGSETKQERFQVLSAAASLPAAMNYGADIGTVTLVVFAEQRAQERPMLVSEEAEDLAAVSRAEQPAKPPENLGALKIQLRQNAQSGGSRGLIVPGEKQALQVREVAFKPDPTPILCATLTYYRP